MSSSTWPAWQEAYRFGVVLIFPPEPVLSLVNSLRARYDPRSQASCDAHVSLTVPAPRAIVENSLRELQSVAARWAPLRMLYGPPRVHPTYPGVTLHVEPQAELRQLCADLEAAPPFAGATPRRWPFSPHMTIAEFVNQEESRKILEELAPLDLVGEFTCRFVSLAVPDEAFHFTEHHRFPLGGAADEVAS